MLSNKLVLIISLFFANSIFAQNITSVQCGLIYGGGLAIDSIGNIYIAEPNQNKIRKIDKITNAISLIAGTGAAGYSGDGGLAVNAQINDVSSVQFDKNGNLFFADYLNNVVRKIDMITGIITTVAGNGNGASSTPGGYSGDGGPAILAELNWPTDIALDATGNIYISEQQSGTIRFVNIFTGIITTVAGNGTLGYTGDGGLATSAQLYAPTSIALDSVGNIYIGLEAGGPRLRKVDATTGVINTIAGNGILGYTGDGGPALTASFREFNDLYIDKQGDVILTDCNNNVIRKINTNTGIVNTIIGDASNNAGIGDGGLAINARLIHPSGFAKDLTGNIYFCGGWDHEVRVVYDCGNYIPKGSVSFALSQNTFNYYTYTGLYWPNIVDSVKWYWGDGTSSLGLNGMHQYAFNGSYNICAVTYDSCGDSLSHCQSYNIYIMHLLCL